MMIANKILSDAQVCKIRPLLQSSKIETEGGKGPFPLCLYLTGYGLLLLLQEDH